MVKPFYFGAIFVLLIKAVFQRLINQGVINKK